MDETVRDLKQPVLGICLGMQLLCRHSEENDTNCLDIIPVDVRRFQQQGHDIKIPQIGWNNIYELKSELFKGIENNSYIYNVHSYYAEDSEYTIAKCDYGITYASAIKKDNFYGVQFHAEKIGRGRRTHPEKFYQSMTIIPAIDIIDGKCVRLTQGDFSQKKIYNEHPLEVAKQFEDVGLKRLHLVDLDGAKEGRVKNWKVLETIAGKTSLVIDFGGGIKTQKDVHIVFDSGAKLATIGSIAITDEQEFVKWLLIFGADRFLLGADVKSEKIAIHGWQETSEIWIYDFIERYIQHGIKQIFCTDISKDGKLEGPAQDLYKNIIEKFPDLHLVASGGVSSMKDLEELEKIGCSAVIIGKAIYENRIKLDDLKKFNE